MNLLLQFMSENSQITWKINKLGLFKFMTLIKNNIWKFKIICEYFFLAN